jgi:hypothetical protein
MQGKCYDLIVDAGADVSVVQPYFWDRHIEETQHMVRGVTGELLETRGSKN